jgi:hypothetical protein
MHINRSDLLGDGPVILHDTARLNVGKIVTDLLSKYEWEVLTHAQYSPGISPPDFYLFHKLKEVSATFTRAIRGPNKSGTLNGTVNLPKRCDAFFEKKGDYIAGL